MVRSKDRWVVLRLEVVVSEKWSLNRGSSRIVLWIFSDRVVDLHRWVLARQGRGAIGTGGDVVVTKPCVSWTWVTPTT